MSRVNTQLVIEGKNNTKKAFEEVNGSLNLMSGIAKTAGAALVGALSVGVISNWVKQSALATAQMQRMADLSGANVEEFQKWGYAAQSVGIEQDKLGDIFKDVQDKIGDFLQTGGGPMADFFENIAPKLGVTAEQFRNLSGPAALELYVSSLDQANLSQSEMTFYMEAIANDATLLLPLLRDNAAGFKELAKEAEDLGLVLSSEDAAGAVQFQRNLQTTGAIAEGAGRQISAELVPTLNELNGLFVDTAKEGGYTAQVAAVLSFGLKVLASAVIITGNAFGSLARFVGGAAAAAASAAQGEFKQAADIIRMVGEDNARETGLAMDRVSRLWSGAYEEAGKTATQVRDRWSAVNEQMASGAQVSADKVKEAYKSIAKEAKARIKEMTAAEREANSEVEKLRSQRLDIEKRYSEAYAEFQGGSAGASFGNVQVLRAGARRALTDGNYEEAQRQAQAALKMMRELAAAGENTYGFTGIAKSLEQVEKEANRLQQSAADEKLKSITTELEALREKADIKITASMPPEEVSKVIEQIKQLAAAIGKEFVITPTIALPNGQDFTQPYTLQDPGPAPTGFATGGHVRGPGTGTSDSILARLSNGEYVMRAAAVKQYGTALLDRMNGLHLPAFADGGMVEAAMSAPAAPSFPNLGRMVLEGGGQQVPIYVAPEQGPNLQRLALKFRGTTRR